MALQNSRVVPEVQPHTPKRGDAMGDTMVKTSERKIGNTKIVVYRPVLTDEERERRMDQLYKAIARCVKSGMSR